MHSCKCFDGLAVLRFWLWQYESNFRIFSEMCTQWERDLQFAHVCWHWANRNVHSSQNGTFRQDCKLRWQLLYNWNEHLVMILQFVTHFIMPPPPPPCFCHVNSCKIHLQSSLKSLEMLCMLHFWEYTGFNVDNTQWNCLLSSSSSS